MLVTAENSIASRLRDKINLPGSVESLSASYKTAKPYPHLVMDGLFPSEMLDRLIGELPSMNDDNWVHEDDERIKQYNLRSAVELGDVGFQLTALLHSATFLYLLSEITGIWDLLPDPYLQGGGYHVIPSGGKFDVHADRNTAYSTGLTRRLSLLIYLNKDWKHEYGGQLELWNSDATKQEVVIEPLFNRTTIFEITDVNFHGVPKPIAAPNGRTRNCFVTYYHTVGAAGLKDTNPHSSIYAPKTYQKKKSAIRKFARDITPPILQRALVNLRHPGSKNGNHS
jgi:hypothetical protein